MFKNFIFLCFIFLALFSSSYAQTPTAAISTSSYSYNSAGGDLVLTLSVRYSPSNVSALGWLVTIPAGWSYISSGGSTKPGIAPAANSISTLEFAFSDVPSSGLAEFTVNISYPAGQTGSKLISASVETRSPKQEIVVPSLTFYNSSEGPVPAAITTQPSSQSVVAGGSASFSVAASGSALNYQWNFNGTPIAGATSSTYSFSNAQSANSGNYTVTVSNSANSVTSSAATLSVTAAPTAPTITTQPSSSSNVVGNAVSFSVSVSGTAPFSYQWRKDGVPIGGATSATYSISSTATSDAASYTVVVTNGVGSVTSTSAVLTITAAATAPIITTQPSSLSITAGAAASFSVAVSGTSPFTYQWKKDGATINGATAASYTISSTSTVDGASYTVVITNSMGSVTSNVATLSVASPAPVIKIQPSGLTINQGQNATFTVGLETTGSYNYQWKKDGVAIVGATGSTLRLVNVIVAQAGSYSVVVTNNSGSVTSNAANLTVNSSLTITANPVSRAAGIGDTMSSAFSVTATAAAGVNLSYQWRRDGVNIAGATSATLALASIKASDFGAYSVTVSSPTATITSSPAVLYRVSDPVVAPVITREPKGITIKAGSSLILSVSASGSPAPTYQWQLNGTAVPGATASTLVLTDILASQAGSYNVVVTNSAGSATSKSATVVINDGFGRQLNLSTLGYVGTGGDILIPGFVVAGNGIKRLLIRAAGPALAQFGVSDVLVDPQLAVFKGSVEWLSNDNWSSDAANAASVVTAGNSVGAFALTAGSKDSALVASLDPGAYSIQVSGVGGTTGKAIVEAYDLDAADPDKSRLVNLATRALVQSGAGPLISGFVVQGAVAKAVLIRATGPALAGFGVTGTLALPKLTVFDSTSTPIAENTGWESSGISDQIIAASQSVGAFALTRGTADSVVLAVLPPGSYTAQVIGADGGSGVTLVEVYELP
jgi:hypothetical protein